MSIYLKKLNENVRKCYQMKTYLIPLTCISTERESSLLRLIKKKTENKKRQSCKKIRLYILRTIKVNFMNGISFLLKLINGFYILSNQTIKNCFNAESHTTKKKTNTEFRKESVLMPKKSQSFH